MMQLFSYFHYGTQGNAVLLLLLFCSIGGIAVFVERLWEMRRAEMDTHSFMIQLREWLERGDYVRSIEACEEAEGAVARMIHAGLLRHERSGEQIEAAMEIAGKREIAQLEKNAKILSLLAHIAPLMGLLGTVLGFIQAFSEMRMSGLVDISTTKLGEAMEYALVTTAAGLVVAIPAVLAYNYLVSRIEGFVLEMHTASAEIVEHLQSRRER